MPVSLLRIGNMKGYNNKQLRKEFCQNLFTELSHFVYNDLYDRGGFPLANFLARSDLFPLSVSLITSARRGKMDADKGKRSLRAKKFASGKPALV